MAVDVTVITPTVPERAIFLGECIASVFSQTVTPVSHLIGMDLSRRGPAMVRSDLIAAATTHWVAFLDDDDLLDPDHLEVLVAASAGHDVVGSYCRFDGPPLPDKYCNRRFDLRVLRQHGCFPITVLARRQAIIDADGFRPDDRYEDWSLWNRVADNGGTFLIVPRETWTYRTAHAGRRTTA